MEGHNMELYLIALYKIPKGSQLIRNELNTEIALLKSNVVAVFIVYILCSDLNRFWN